VAEEKGFRPGVVSVVQTFGDRANFHPHVHALASRGGWTVSGEWIPVPYVDEAAAEELFRHKVLALLHRRGLLSPQRIELLLSWRRSGFSIHNRVWVHPGNGREFEALVRYMMRPPVSLSRLRFTPGSHEVAYAHKGGHDEPEQTEGERIDAMEFVARVLVQIPPAQRHAPLHLRGLVEGEEAAARDHQTIADRPVHAVTRHVEEALGAARLPDFRRHRRSGRRPGHEGRHVDDGDAGALSGHHHGGALYDRAKRVGS